LLPAEADELPFHVEHVIARQHGGNDELPNLCWSCSRCNLYKGPNIAGLDRVTDNLTALYNPREQAWNSHFALQNSHIIGTTDVGRTTAQLLHMNDSERVELRRDLLVRGVFQTW
jgi:hypothetical protein